MLAAYVFFRHGPGPYFGYGLGALLVALLIVILILYFVPNVDPILRKVLIAIPCVLFALWLIAIIFSAFGSFGGEGGY